MTSPGRRPVLAVPQENIPRRNFLARTLTVLTGGALFLRGRDAVASTQGQNPFIGEIALFGFNFAPIGWAQCNGQLLPISQNTALFSLLGTMYGGDGISTFALPDLRGRVPIHTGQGPGLSSYFQGQVGGTEIVTLLSNQVPAHTHPLIGTSAVGTSDTPTGLLPARNAAGEPIYGSGAPAAMGAAAVGLNTGGLPHSNVQPYLTLNWCIALVGIFPSRA